MTWYSIYKNMSKNDFEKIKKSLESIEKISSPIMQMKGFYLNRIAYDEGLDLDYVSEGGNFKGNIGVTFDEDNSINENPMFSFYVLKAYDTTTHRFYRKDGLKQPYSLKEVENMFVELFIKCFNLYNSLQKKDLTESIEFRK